MRTYERQYVFIYMKPTGTTTTTTCPFCTYKKKHSFIPIIIILILLPLFLIIIMHAVLWSNIGHFGVNGSSLSDDDRWVGFVTRKQFGNQLWEIASTHGIAKSRNSRWCLIDYDGAFGSKYAEYLQWTVQPPETCPGLIWLTHVFYYTPMLTAIGDDGKYATYSERFIKSNSNRIRVDSYLQSFKYFDKLHPVPFILKATQIAQTWVKMRNINTAIHVRRGDKVGDNSNVVPPLSYFTLAISTLNELFPLHGREFVVVTDDITWVGQNEPLKNMNILKSDDLGFDMAVISACQHKILSIGTFGWWGAFLNDTGNNSTSAVIYPTIQMQGSLKDGFNNDDYFPAHWTGI